MAVLALASGVGDADDWSADTERLTGTIIAISLPKSGKNHPYLNQPFS